MYSNLSLYLTNKCSLSCKYCIQEKSNNIMPINIAFRAIDLFKENTEAENVGLLLFGGEVFLLDNDYISNIILYFSKQFHNCGRSFSVSTNLYYNINEKLDIFKLIQHEFDDINIAISIDGTEESHNKNRIDKNNNGSYNTVIKNAKIIKEIFGKNIIVNMVVTNNTIQHLSSNYIDIINTLGIYNIKILFDQYTYFSDKEILLLKEELNKLYQFITTKPELFYCNNNFNTNPDGSRKSFCSATAKTQFAVDEHGYIYPCNIMSALKIMKIGSVFDGKIDNINLNFNFSGITECNKCNNKRCKICIANNYIRNKSFDKIDINQCKLQFVYNKFVNDVFKYYNHDLRSDNN